MMCGQVKHAKIFSSIVPDWRLVKLLASLRAKNTDALIGGVAKILADEGIHLRGFDAAARRLCWRGEGVLTRRKPSSDEERDIDYGRRIAAALSELRYRAERRHRRARLRRRRSHGRHRRHAAPRRLAGGTAAASRWSRYRAAGSICCSTCRWSGRRPSPSCAKPAPPRWRSTPAARCCSIAKNCSSANAAGIADRGLRASIGGVQYAVLA